MLRALSFGDAHTVFILWGNLRFESFATATRAKSDEDLREELLRRLVDRQLLGPSHQILMDGDIERLPLRELPPGNVASLYLMFVAYTRTTDSPVASKSTFYKVARKWNVCLRFRRRTEHSLCIECSRLKAAIHGCSETWFCYLLVLTQDFCFWF